MSELPNFFLADLPQEADLTPEMVEESCRSLHRNRERYLEPRSTSSLIRMLHELGRLWMEPDNPFRQRALQEGPHHTQFSRQTIEQGLDGFFRQLTEEQIHLLLRQDLGDVTRLDSFAPSEPGGSRLAMAIGPKLLVHITGGLLPNAPFQHIILGLLTKSAQFVKCASGSSFLPRLLAHSIYEIEPKLGACIEIAEWRGGRQDLESRLWKQADCVTGTGSEATLQTLRAQLPRNVRFLGYGHRVSFAFISQESFSRLSLPALVQKAATDVSAWDQVGCLSPHCVYIEHGGSTSAEQFAELLAEELERRESTHPRGPLPAEIAAEITARRGFYQVRSAASPETTRCWFSKGSTAWSVVYEADPLFQPSCMNRFIYIKGVASLDETLQSAESVRGHVSTVGLAVSDLRIEQVANRLAQWGATRLCPLGQMQNPAFSWRHDGRPSLGDLVTWCDWEGVR